MVNIKWCAKLKNGIKLIEPNQNVAESYFLKADNAISNAITSKTEEWKAISAYYACYDAIYAMLQKVGIKCENHECSIALMEFLGFSSEEINFIKDLRDNRESAQYYVNKPFKVEDLNKVKDFVLKCREMFYKSDFNKIRDAIIADIS